MTTATEGKSTVESRTMALAMFQGNIPCSLQFFDPPCPKNAAWLAYFDHEENTVSSCAGQEPMLLCDEHKRVITAATHPFWRMWNNVAPMLCIECDTPIRIERVEAI